MEIIRYTLFGLHLQEPMALITNGLIAIFSFWAYSSLRNDPGVSSYWKMFYLFLGCSTTCGAIGHSFFEYFDVAGKMPSWSLGCLANVFASLAMLDYDQKVSRRNKWVLFVWLKSACLLIISVVTLKFIFVACDAIISYLLFTGAYAIKLRKTGIQSMKYMILGVAILLPSAFVYILKWNPYRWLNKDDISHLLILAAIVCFYIGVKRAESKQLKMADYV